MRYLLGLAILMIPGPTMAQEVQRYIGTNRKPTPVDDAHRLPVAPGPNGTADAALLSSEAHQQSSGVTITGRAVLYSLTITVSTGQGPGRLMMWDAATVPADGALAAGSRPLRCLFIDPDDRTITFGSANGIGLQRGLAWAFSTASSCQQLTRATADFVAVSYKGEQP